MEFPLPSKTTSGKERTIKHRECTRVVATSESAGSALGVVAAELQQLPKTWEMATTHSGVKFLSLALFTNFGCKKGMKGDVI